MREKETNQKIKNRPTLLFVTSDHASPFFPGSQGAQPSLPCSSRREQIQFVTTIVAWRRKKPHRDGCSQPRNIPPRSRKNANVRGQLTDGGSARSLLLPNRVSKMKAQHAQINQVVYIVRQRCQGAPVSSTNRSHALVYRLSTLTRAWLCACEGDPGLYGPGHRPRRATCWP